uniref:Protein kinase domain-containing protein n=1 Tax=Helianthus annuus TaxID=4232 RepID=A0A251RN64_HELAN
METVCFRWLHEIKCQKPSSLWTCLLKGVVHLGHRNLVTIQDVLIKKDYSLILYKYVENGSLYDGLLIHLVKMMI